MYMATKTQVNDFISKLSELAINEYKRRKKAEKKWVLPSVCIAQAALETGWGTSPLMVKANAYFGIKAGTGWTGRVYSTKTQECYNGRDYTTITDLFRAYGSLAESVADYFDLITGLDRYKKACNQSDARTCIQAIKDGGYATSPAYVTNVMAVINQYDLTKYDSLGGVEVGQAKQIMDRAASYIGVKESPAGSNNVVFNTHYYGGKVSGSAYPWCCAFVWDIFRMCGLSQLFYDGQKTAYCPTVYNWARQKGLIVPKETARYGDIVLFDWGGDGVADHIGFVEAHYGNAYATIEGNTSVDNNSNGGQVMRRTRYASQIQAIIRPKYTNTGGNYMFEVKTVQKGEKGNHVLLVQEILRARKHKGKDGKALKLDKICGANLVYAIKQYQRAREKAQPGSVGAIDGVAGPKTLRDMIAL